jgi:hypothetical protein
VIDDESLGCGRSLIQRRRIQRISLVLVAPQSLPQGTNSTMFRTAILAGAAACGLAFSASASALQAPNDNSITWYSARILNKKCVSMEQGARIMGIPNVRTPQQMHDLVESSGIPTGQLQSYFDGIVYMFPVQPFGESVPTYLVFYNNKKACDLANK